MYIQLKELLQERIVSDVSAIKSVAWFNDQYKNTKEQKAESYPAVYIEILDPVNWKQLGDGLQTAKMNIQLHVVLFNLKDEPNAVMELAQLLHVAIQRKCLLDVNDKQITSELCRISSTLPKMYNQLKVMKVTYECEFYDDSAIPVQVAISSPNFIINMI